MAEKVTIIPGSYATEITHVKIVKEDGEWFLDGRDESGNYSEACWSYDTGAEAIEAIDSFIAALVTDYGVSWKGRCRA